MVMAAVGGSSVSRPCRLTARTPCARTRFPSAAARARALAAGRAAPGAGERRAALWPHALGAASAPDGGKHEDARPLCAGAAWTALLAGARLERKGTINCCRECSFFHLHVLIF